MIEELEKTKGKRGGRTPKGTSAKKKGKLPKDEEEEPPETGGAAASAPKPAAPSVAAMSADASVKGVTRKQKKKEAEAASGQSKLMILILKQLLNLVQGQRDLQSVLFDVVTIPAKSALAVACSVQGKRYASAASVKGHALGPPHLYIFGTMLNWAGKESEALQTAFEKYQKMGITERAELIKLCKCSKLFDPEMKKMVLAFGPGPGAQECRAKLLQALVAIPEASHKIGKAPKGYMERELQNWLTDLL
jgi:hypothetical protein